MWTRPLAFSSSSSEYKYPSRFNSSSSYSRRPGNLSNQGCKLSYWAMCWWPWRFMWPWWISRRTRWDIIRRARWYVRTWWFIWVRWLIRICWFVTHINSYSKLSLVIGEDSTIVFIDGGGISECNCHMTTTTSYYAPGLKLNQLQTFVLG